MVYVLIEDNNGNWYINIEKINYISDIDKNCDNDYIFHIELHDTFNFLFSDKETASFELSKILNAIEIKE